MSDNNKLKLDETDFQTSAGKNKKDSSFTPKKLLPYAGAIGTVVSGMLSNVWSDYIHDHPDKYSGTIDRIMKALFLSLKIASLVLCVAIVVYLIVKLISGIKRKEKKSIFLNSILLILMVSFLLGFFLLGKGQVQETEKQSDNADYTVSETVQSKEDFEDTSLQGPDSIVIASGQSVSGSFDENTDEYIYSITLENVSDVELEFESDIETAWARPNFVLSLADDDQNIVNIDEVNNDIYSLFTLNPGIYYATVKRGSDDEQAYGQFTMTINTSKSDASENVGGTKTNFSDAYELVPNKGAANGIVYASRQENYYKFSLDDTSKVLIDYSSEIAGNWQRPDIELFDTDKKLMVRFKDAENTALDAYTLDGGVYYVLVKGSGDYLSTFGNYSIGINAERSDQGPNVGGVKENYSDAVILEPDGGALNGILYSSRLKSYYYFELDQTASVSIGFSSQISEGWQRPNINIIDGKTRETVYSVKDIANGFSEVPPLNPGKYYVEIVTDGNAENLDVFGNYQISVSAQMSDGIVDKGAADMMSATPVSLDNTDLGILGSLSLDQKTSYYGFSISDNSRVSISMSSEISQKPDISLIDENGGIIWKERNSVDKELRLNAGKYYICISSSGSNDYNLGSFDLSVTKTETGTPVNVYGESFEKAESISANGDEYYGLFTTEHNGENYYVFDLNEDSNLTIEFTADDNLTNNPNIRLFDKSHKDRLINERYSDKAFPYTYKETLAAGRYYLQIAAYNGNIGSIGNYSFAVKAE